MNFRLLSLPVIVAAGCVVSPLHAEVKLSRVFTPHMVLQRNMAVPIYGTAAPGEKVTVKFRDQSKTAEADKDGKWSVKLDSLKAGGPDVLMVGEKKIDDVLVGDVWIGAGQSNMDAPVSSCTATDPVLAGNAQATYPKLRLLKKGTNDTWQQATPATIPGFSALLFSFGMPLQRELDVPIGLMVGSTGGSPTAFWLTEEMYRSDEACTETAKKFAATYNFDEAMAKYNDAKAKYDKELEAWKPLEAAAKAEGKTPPPGPRGPGLPGKAGETNGPKIGNLFDSIIRPYVGYGIHGVLWDGDSGTGLTGVPNYPVMGALIKGWRKAWGQGDFPFLYVQKPCGGGCAWDYNNPITSKADKFTPEPEAIPPGMSGDNTHAYFATFTDFPKTYMIPTTDLGAGPQPGAQPLNKSGYGSRAVQVAMNAVYGIKCETSGPTPESWVFDSHYVVMNFSHFGKGITFKNGTRLQGFMVAGGDRKFFWAEAEIIGDNSILISSDNVARPETVRYAWSSQHPWANLFNQEGLPAQPFRLDTW